MPAAYVPSIWQKNIQVFKFLRTFRKQHINKDELRDANLFSAQ